MALACGGGLTARIPALHPRLMNKESRTEDGGSLSRSRGNRDMEQRHECWAMFRRCLRPLPSSRPPRT